MLDNHYPVGVAMTPAFVPAVIAMFAELGACAVAAMMVAVAAVPDHDGFGAGDRRRCDSNRAKCCNNVSKLLHAVLLGCARIKPHTSGNVPGEFEENSEQPFSNGEASSTSNRFPAGSPPWAQPGVSYMHLCSAGVGLPLAVNLPFRMVYWPCWLRLYTARKAPSDSNTNPYSRVCLSLGKKTRKFSMPFLETSAVITSLSSEVSPKSRRCMTRSPGAIS